MDLGEQRARHEVRAGGCGAERSPQFDNVFVSHTAYKSFLENGRWPEKTMFVLEVRGSESKGSINNGGHYQGSDFRLSAEVKDSSRFASLGSGGWQFFSLPANGEPGAALPENGRLHRVPFEERSGR